MRELSKIGARSHRLVLALGVSLLLLAGGCSRQQGPSAGATGGGSTTPVTGASVTPTPSPIATPTEKPHPAGSWELLPAAPIVAPETLAGVWDGSQLLIVGRVTIHRPPYAKVVAAAYDPATRTWRKLTGAPRLGGNFEGGDRAVWTGSEMLLWGLTNTAYDPATNTWRRLPDPPTGWGGPSVAVWTGHQMIGWGGGCCGDAYGDGAAYSPATNTWKMLPKSPLSPRHAQGAWTGKELILAGGEGPEGKGVFADAAAYDPATHTWRKLPAMPVARAGATAVWDGHEVLIVGGTRKYGSGEFLARGVAYDPSTNRWRWLPPMTYPRSGHVAAWTGDRLLVWGGYTMHDGISGYPPNGEAYDPATDTWSALPKAPLRHRSSAVGVWTGSAMIVWGGQNEQGALASGAAYTPGRS